MVISEASVGFFLIVRVVIVNEKNITPVNEMVPTAFSTMLAYTTQVQSTEMNLTKLTN